MKSQCLNCGKVKPISLLISGICYECREKELEKEEIERIKKENEHDTLRK